MKKAQQQLMAAEELARDPDFQKWVLHTDSEEYPLWTKYQQEDSETADTILLAKEIVRLTTTGQQVPDCTPRIHRQLMQKVNNARRYRHFRYAGMGVATTFGLLLITIVHFRNASQNGGPLLAYTASFGEQKTVTLPDGSMVVLNANSALKLGDRWSEGIREVWLEGEAYFEVRKEPTKESRFTVHAAGLDVEVLGTHFNVNAREDETLVFLEEGKVRLLVLESPDELKELYLDPGDLAQINAEGQRIIQQTKDQAKSVTSWKAGYLVYRNATLAELIKDIYHTYGKKVRLEDDDLLSRRINGAIPTNNLPECIRVAELLFGVEVDLRDDELFFNQTR